MAKKYFLTVRQGSFSERPGQGQYETMNKVEGHIVGITYKDSAHGELIRVHIVNQENFYLISMFANSRAAHGFYMAIQNVDQIYPVELKLNQLEPGKDVLQIHQHGNMVDWFYTATNSTLPKDINERLPFLKNVILKQVVPQIQKKKNPYPLHKIYKPMSKGLQGGYFDEYECNARMIKPVGEAERLYNERGY